MKKETDWKKIAGELAVRVRFAIEHCKCRGTGELLDTKTYKTQHWKDYMADGLDMLPGWTVDREAMFALDLPKKQRDKFFADKKAKKEAAQAKP